MKKNILIIAFLAVSLGVTAFSFKKWNTIKKTEEITPENAAVVTLPSFNTTFGNKLPTNLQDKLVYRITPRSGREVFRSKLLNATSLSDIIPYYPENWIEAYNKVEVSAHQNGEKKVAKGLSSELNKEQIEIIQSADFGDDISIVVEYSKKNAVSNKIEDYRIDVTYTVMPERNAEYPGGLEELQNYLKANSKEEVKNKAFDQLQKFSTQFTVTSSGKIDNIELLQTSGYSDTDKLLIALLKEMPAWQPAQCDNGKPIAQEFVFTFSGPGC